MKNNHNQQVVNTSVWKKRLALWLVPTLLSLVAVSQITMVHTLHLRPWKGGGFGMFSNFSKRSFMCEGLDTEGNLCVIKLSFSGKEPEKEFNRKAKQWLIFRPDRKKLERYAKIILASELRRDKFSHRRFLKWLDRHKDFSTNIETPKPESKWSRIYRLLLTKNTDRYKGQKIRLKAVRIQPCRLHFDPVSFEISSEPLGEPIEVGDWG